MGAVMISHTIEAVVNINRLSKKMFLTYIARNANDEVDILFWYRFRVFFDLNNGPPFE